MKNSRTIAVSQRLITKPILVITGITLTLLFTTIILLTSMISQLKVKARTTTLYSSNQVASVLSPVLGEFGKEVDDRVGVKLNGIRYKKYNELSWSLKDASLIENIWIQRIRDEEQWETIKQLSPADGSMVFKDYLNHETEYGYRMMLKTFDGETHMSNLITLGADVSSDLEVVYKDGIVTLNGNPKQDGMLAIYSKDGSVIKAKRVYANTLHNQISIEELDTGYYFVVLRNEGIEKRIRI